MPSVVDFHGLNVYEQDGSGHIDLHITLERTQELASAHEVGHALSARIEAELTGLAVNVHVEPCDGERSEEHTSELQSHSFISYAVFCLKKKKRTKI